MCARREQLDVEDRIAVGLHVERLDVRIGKCDDRTFRRLDIPDPALPLQPSVRRVFEDGIRSEEQSGFPKPACVVVIVVLPNHGMDLAGHRDPAVAISHCSAASSDDTTVVARNRSRANTANSFPVLTAAGSVATIAQTPYSSDVRSGSSRL